MALTTVGRTISIPGQAHPGFTEPSRKPKPNAQEVGYGTPRGSPSCAESRHEDDRPKERAIAAKLRPSRISSYSSPVGLYNSRTRSINTRVTRRQRDHC